MLLGGLWHGASWNFVLWGAWWGVWLAVAHLWRRAPERARRLIPGWAAWLGTLCIAVVGWAPFRCVGFGRTKAMLSRIFSAETMESILHLRFVRASEFSVAPATAAVAAFAVAVLVFVHVAASALRLDRLDPDERP